MSSKPTAYCGLICIECPAYVAKRTGDGALRAATAKMWSGPDFSVSPEEVSCDGCAEPGRELFRYCEACEGAELRGTTRDRDVRRLCRLRLRQAGKALRDDRVRGP
jgi:hypothetical protein